MSRVESPALRGTWIGSVLRFWNPIMRALLATPLHWPLSRWFLLISWTGTKTGQARATPVSYVCDGDTIDVTTGDRWPRFVAGNDSFRVRLKGRCLRREGQPDPAAIDRSLQAGRQLIRIAVRESIDR